MAINNEERDRITSREQKKDVSEVCFSVHYLLYSSSNSAYLIGSHFLFFFNDTATTEIYTLSLTRRSSDHLADVDRGPRVVADHADGSLRWRRQPADDADHRRLSGAVRSQQGGEARRNRRCDAAQ